MAAKASAWGAAGCDLACRRGQWTLLYALELGTADIGLKLVFSKLEYIGVGAVPVAWLLLARQYTLPETDLRSPRWLLLAVIPAFTLLLALTNEWHGLIWQKIEIVKLGTGETVFSMTYGPAFWLFWAYLNTALLVGTWLLIRAFRNTAAFFRKQIGLLLLAAFLPWLSNLPLCLTSVAARTA